MSFWRTVWIILRKDLAIERRSGEIVLSTFLFALLVVLLSAFAFGLNHRASAETAAGVLWIASAFSGLLAISRTFLREREHGVWTAMLMTPAPKGAVYLGKVLGVAVFLLSVALLLLPLVELFFHAPLLSHLPELLPLFLLGIAGYAAVGCLFGSMTIHTRLRDVLLGSILYPLVAPILIAGVMGSAAVLKGEGWTGASDHMELLAVIDIIYLVGGLWLFGPMMEE